jgi:hypothetical protein
MEPESIGASIPSRSSRPASRTTPRSPLPHRTPRRYGRGSHRHMRWPRNKPRLSAAPRRQQDFSGRPARAALSSSATRPGALPSSATASAGQAAFQLEFKAKGNFGAPTAGKQHNLGNATDRFFQETRTRIRADTIAAPSACTQPLTLSRIATSKRRGHLRERDGSKRRKTAIQFSVDRIPLSSVGASHSGACFLVCRAGVDLDVVPAAEVSAVSLAGPATPVAQIHFFNKCRSAPCRAAPDLPQQLQPAGSDPP